LLLDDKDLKIIEFLKKDSRTPFTTIGKELGITDATVYNRVKKMVDEGIIKKFTVNVDEKLNKSAVNGFLLVDVVPGHMDAVVKALLSLECVAEVYEVYAPKDLLVLIKVDSNEKLRDCVRGIRYRIQYVVDTSLITGLKKWAK